MLGCSLLLAIAHAYFLAEPDGLPGWKAACLTVQSIFWLFTLEAFILVVAHPCNLQAAVAGWQGVQLVAVLLKVIPAYAPRLWQKAKACAPQTAARRGLLKTIHVQVKLASGQDVVQNLILNCDDYAADLRNAMQRALTAMGKEGEISLVFADGATLDDRIRIRDTGLEEGSVVTMVVLPAGASTQLVRADSNWSIRIVLFPIVILLLVCVHAIAVWIWEIEAIGCDWEFVYRCVHVALATLPLCCIIVCVVAAFNHA